MNKLVRRSMTIAAFACAMPVWAQYSTPMRDVDNPARQPFTDGGTIVITDGSQQGSMSLNNVPAGKRLVVETVSFYTQNGVPTGQLGFLEVQASNASLFHVVPGVKMVSATPTLDIVGNVAPVRMYIDPGAHINLNFWRGGSIGLGQVSVTLTGYLVNLP